MHYESWPTIITHALNSQLSDKQQHYHNAIVHSFHPCNSIGIQDQAGMEPTSGTCTGLSRAKGYSQMKESHPSGPLVQW